MNHIVRAVVFLRSQDMTKFLLLHKVDPDKQWWQTVAGGWKPPESYKDGAIRETVEETGLTPVNVYDLEYEPEFVNSKGKDKDQIDVFVNDGATKDSPVYIVNQINPDTGKFDEHKV